MFPTGMNVLEHFGPIKEAACLFKRDIQLARLFEKIAKKRRKRKEKYRFQSKCIWWGGWRGGDCMEAVDYGSRRIKSFQPCRWLFSVVRLVISLKM